jgi:hypothetical protein
MAKSRKGYSVTVADIKNVVNILFLNDKYGRKESIATMTTKAEVSREIFLKVLSILEKRDLVTRIGFTRNCKFLWNRDKSSPSEAMYLSIHNEYYKKVEKIKKVKSESNRITLEKCLIYLKDHGFHGEIYTTEQSACLTKKLVYILS